jgi:hypothetical protein
LIYLAFTEGRELGRDEPGPWTEVFPLRPGLALIDSDESRSTVYHALKDVVGDGALLVAPLTDAPKFKGVAPGALRWVRDHFGG